jgi:N-acetylglucosamine-6-phosphate deacetylase
MKAIVNTKLILIDSIIWNGVVLFDEKGIIEYGNAEKITIPEGTEIIDAGGNYTGPGFVDIHAHGGGGYWFHEYPEKAAYHFLKNGETTVLPALYFNLSLDEYLEGIAKVREAMQVGAGRIIGGIYMEGPYMNPKYGADQENNKWKGAIDKNQYMKLLEAGRDIIKVWCIAPEREGIEEFVSDAKGPGVIFSAAHSEAYPDDVFKFLPDGLKLETHFNDATGAVVKYPEVRGVGIDEAALLNDNIYIELICDSEGVHVDPYMLRLAVKVKGRDKIILISDSTEFDGPEPTTFKPAPDLKYDFDEGIAGSALTLNMACQNMMKHTGAGICDVFRYASLNPAILLGMEDRIGRIKKGAKANLIIVDDMINIKSVILDGCIFFI